MRVSSGGRAKEQDAHLGGHARAVEAQREQRALAVVVRVLVIGARERLGQEERQREQVSGELHGGQRGRASEPWECVDTKNDLVPTTLRYPDREGEIMNIRYNPNHKWKYLRNMGPDEAVLIKW